VLDRPNVGVVLAATARFFSSVKWTEEKVRSFLEAREESAPVSTTRYECM